ncbi:hypothetical protein BH24DEI2_BH24DEI2_03050 [soil metagenome]
MRRWLLVWLALGSLAAAQLELLPSSAVEYTASDPSGSWSGRAPVAALTFDLDPENIPAATLSVTVQAGAFDSGNFIRDANARRVVFETGEYPDIRFDLASAQTVDNRLADGETAQVDLSGTLTMHGVTRDVTTTASVSRTGTTFTATGALEILLSDYGMKRPSFFGTSVDDAVTVVFDVQARRP